MANRSARKLLTLVSRFIASLQSSRQLTVCELEPSTREHVTAPINNVPDKPILVALFALFIAVSPQAHPSPRYIELADGSVIKGEVVSAANGTYRVKTAAMGVLELKEADIRSIASSAPTGGPPAADVAGTAEAPDIQRRILSDPELLKSIHALQGDPAVESILRDPEVMRAIQSRDVRALQNNDKIERLIESPAVRDVLNALTK